MKPIKPLDFIHIRDTDGRLSHFNIYGRMVKNGHMVVSGNLPHNTEFKPESIEDAEKWIVLLKEFIEIEEEKKREEIWEEVSRAIDLSLGLNGFHGQNITIKKGDPK